MFFSVLRYIEKDAMVPICTGITETYCDLSGFIMDHRTAYKVRVQQVAGDDESEWKLQKFLPNDGKHSCMLVWCNASVA